ncbi:MAG: hypothetical protein AAFQ91_22595, partial [Cyanobacteria bacterium J06621_15]
QRARRTQREEVLEDCSIFNKIDIYPSSPSSPSLSSPIIFNVKSNNSLKPLPLRSLWLFILNA